MIKYNVSNVDTINEIKVTGHANYKKFGEDIVCASISTALILSVNLIERFGCLKNIDLSVSDGFFQLKVIKNNDTVAIILKNLYETLNELEEQYPKYIKNQKEG